MRLMRVYKVDEVDEVDEVDIQPLGEGELVAFYGEKGSTFINPHQLLSPL